MVSKSSGLIAIDVDNPEQFAQWLAERGLKVPRSATADTSSGYHILLDARGMDWPTQGEIDPARGLGQIKSNGFIAAEPSKHPNGTPYEWREIGMAVHRPDASWMEFFAEREERRGEAGHGAPAVGEPLPDGGHDAALSRLVYEMHAGGFSREAILASWRATVAATEQDPKHPKGLFTEKDFDRHLGGAVRKHGSFPPLTVADRSALRDLGEKGPEAEQRAHVLRVLGWGDVGDPPAFQAGPDGVFPDAGSVLIAGDPGSGKSMLAYWAAIRYARAGLTAAVYDAEMGPERVKALLGCLGATAGDLEKLAYIAAPEPGEIVSLVAHRQELLGLTEEIGARLLILDAENPLMAASGLDSDKAQEVRKFHNMVVRPHVARGVLVLTIDHSGHGDKTRARGSSDKAAAADMVLTIEQAQPFARGRSGQMQVTCRKDRSGVQPRGAANPVAVKSAEDGSVELVPVGWGSEPVEVNPRTKTQSEICRVLLSEMRPLSLSELVNATSIAKTTLHKALHKEVNSDDPLFVQVEGGKWDLFTG